METELQLCNARHSKPEETTEDDMPSTSSTYETKASSKNETLTPVPALPNDLLEEIFLHLPPDEPAWLVRASLASKLWLGLLSRPSFRGRYRELHGAPPMLGYLDVYNSEEPYPAPNFVPTTKFRPRIPDSGWRMDWYYEALDSRHGRVLLGTDDEVVAEALRHGCVLLGTADEEIPKALIVWDPMTGCQTELCKPDPDDYMMYHDHRAAVLCAASGCDHRACHEGPFLVVFVGVVGAIQPGDNCSARATVFSSETGEWSEPCCSLHLEAEPSLASAPPVLIEDALYFKFAHGEDLGILKYDLGSDCLSLIDVPEVGLEFCSEAILMAMEDGSLGFALKDELSLSVWSRQMGSNSVASWTLRRVIDVENLPSMKYLGLKGSVEGSDIIFISMHLGVYEFDLKSLRLKKRWNREKDLGYLIPYMSFYHPQERRLEEERHQQGLGWYVHHE